jgi:hypothetical protein
MKMQSLKRPPADLKKQREGMTAAPTPYTSPDDQGVRVNLEHHHLMALKGADGQPIAGQMKSGHRVSFAGEGIVERSESRSTPDGERHEATIRLHRGTASHKGDRKGDDKGSPAAPRRRMPGTPSYPKEAGDYVK